MRIGRLGIILALIISLLIFLVSCVPTGEAQQGEQGGMGSIYMIVFVVLIIAMLYFTMIRPQRRQQKAHQEMMSQLRNGDKVITSSGIYGEIDSVSEDSAVLKTESGAKIRVTRGSIAVKREKVAGSK
jgi:preprotein translocase subunit YajC